MHGDQEKMLGRERELQLERALIAARPEPYQPPLQPYILTPGREILADGPAFVLERWRAAGAGLLEARPDRPLWIVAVGDGGRIDGQTIEAGSAWLAEAAVELITEENSDLLLAYPGKGLRGFAGFAWAPETQADFRRRRFRDAPRRARAG